MMGTPEIAADAMEALHAAGHTIVGAVCQPDRPKGRGQKLQMPPVKERALALEIPVYQPETLKDGAFDDTVRALAPDLAVVVAYGKLLPASLLYAPRYGSVNLHVSLLPRYRGAAPMQRAIMAGESETGVTVMYMDEGLDTGDMILKETIPLTEDDDFGTLEEKSSTIGKALLVRAVRLIGEGNAPRVPQPTEGVCYAAKITDSDCVLDLTNSAVRLSAQIRGLSPMPLARLTLPDGRALKLVAVRALAEKTDAPCGSVVAVSGKGDGFIDLATGDGILRLLRVKPEGKGTMSAGDFVRGRGIAVGDLLS